MRFLLISTIRLQIQLFITVLRETPNQEKNTESKEREEKEAISKDSVN